MRWHEPYESRGSRTDLREARGEIPRAYSAFSTDSAGFVYLSLLKQWLRKALPRSRRRCGGRLKIMLS